MKRIRIAEPDLIVGIDPGIGGAIAFLVKDGEWVAPMPIEQKSSGRNQVDVRALYSLVETYVTSEDCVRFIIERVSAMPGQGVSSMFSFGDSFGTVRAVAEHFSTTYRPYFVTPQQWKKDLRLLGKPKEASLRLARRLYPNLKESLARKKDEGRAEALLLAHYAKDILKW